MSSSSIRAGCLVTNRPGETAATTLELECEVNSGTHRSKIVAPAIHNVPTEISHPSDMRCETDFESAAKLTFEKIFYVGSTAPGVIRLQISITRERWREIVDRNWPSAADAEIPQLVVISEGVRSPD